MFFRVADSALIEKPLQEVVPALREEFGFFGRRLARRYFEAVRFPESGVGELQRLHEQGFVVHVMRTTAWINYLYLSWALVRRGLPPVRAVVGLRRWFSRPWRHAAQRGDFDVRFTYARRHGGSGLVFLRESAFNTARGRETSQNPFPALVELARKADRPIFLVPELFVWEKWQQKVTPSVFDRVFGSPEAPGFVHSIGAFLRNYQRAQFRVGEPIDLRKFVAENADTPTPVLARKVRSALNHHLARETRAVFGPPRKDPDRLIDEAMRDRGFQKAIAELSIEQGRPASALEREAKKNFDAIAARYSPTVVGLAAPVLHWVFNRIYDGVDVDDAGLERAMKAAAHTPVVLTPSHKSHVDYLIMSYVLWQRGYSAPLVAAGANLAFFPLGGFLRRAGAFFLRRSFKGDKLYTATFKAYLKKLVHDGVHHEFFPEGGRSRTGKLLQPKLGLFTWLVEAVLEGAREDLLFVPVAIDYEKVVESASYTRELAGGEKKPEDLKALLSAPAVLTEHYGRIHLRFDEPVSLAQVMRERGLAGGPDVTEDQKRGIVRVLAHRVMYGINRVSTVTPPALVAAALLAHRRRGLSAREATDRIGLLRRIAEDLKAPLSRQLADAPSSPAVIGPVAEAVHELAEEGLVRIVEARGEPIYQVDDARRLELSFYKNTLLNLVAGRTIVASALLASEADQRLEAVRAKAQFLSRLFKFELIFPVGQSFEQLFDEVLQHLQALGLITREDGAVHVAPEAHARPLLQFLAYLLSDSVECYLLAARGAAELRGAPDKREFLKGVLEAGRADFLAGVIGASEALSKPSLENATAWLVDQQYLVEHDKKVARGAGNVDDLVNQLRVFLPETR